jgi:hypothetical protein
MKLVLLLKAKEETFEQENFKDEIKKIVKRNLKPEVFGNAKID